MLKNCSGNGRCNGQTGECDCYEGYSGTSCSEGTGGGGGGGGGVCGRNSYGASCTEECDMLKNCSGNGRCNGQTGECDCYEGYSGTSCSEGTGGGGGGGGGVCGRNSYGASCTEECDMLKNCSGNGRCKRG
ncbi:hypothetical protein GUITHDRAFT_122543 [Guillardia theta CCMP2712]|uniref:EGF-like domain-containing protein n=1 Tax=Guillardia theta (strain CCMP2712) TaxID=905079 RepID=L1I5X4_GUITC|nr:hypothetical protein GUITHDRAFT_122543 [Guillardia theta CCMP2712]EKX31255.1 hypothetical protein GUITHDRAFT_122543 [Guillardia theta CCMP2712]|eukprot:XP_005818235.1 hypothetical protein GUITHDRAFT_122543 [Guillardia theta CCMP2712]